MAEQAMTSQTPISMTAPSRFLKPWKSLTHCMVKDEVQGARVVNEVGVGPGTPSVLEPKWPGATNELELAEGDSVKYSASRSIAFWKAPREQIKVDSNTVPVRHRKYIAVGISTSSYFSEHTGQPLQLLPAIGDKSEMFKNADDNGLLVRLPDEKHWSVRPSRLTMASSTQIFEEAERAERDSAAVGEDSEMCVASNSQTHWNSFGHGDFISRSVLKDINDEAEAIADEVLLENKELSSSRTTAKFITPSPTSAPTKKAKTNRGLPTNVGTRRSERKKGNNEDNQEESKVHPTPSPVRGPRHLECAYDAAVEDLRAAVLDAAIRAGYTPRPNRPHGKGHGKETIFQGYVPTMEEILKVESGWVRNAKKKVDEAWGALEEAIAKGELWDNTPLPEDMVLEKNDWSESPNVEVGVDMDTVSTTANDETMVLDVEGDSGVTAGDPRSTLATTPTDTCSTASASTKPSKKRKRVKGGDKDENSGSSPSKVSRLSEKSLSPLTEPPTSPKSKSTSSAGTFKFTLRIPPKGANMQILVGMTLSEVSSTAGDTPGMLSTKVESSSSDDLVPRRAGLRPRRVGSTSEQYRGKF